MGLHPAPRSFYPKKYSLKNWRGDVEGMTLFSSVQSLNHVRLFATHELQHARLPSPLPTPGACSNSCPSVMPSNHLILCHPLLLLPSIVLTWSEGVMTLYFNFGASHSTLWLHMILMQTQEVSGGRSLHFNSVQTQPWKDWATVSHSSGLFHRHLLRVHYVPRTSLAD